MVSIFLEGVIFCSIYNSIEIIIIKKTDSQNIKHNSNCVVGRNFFGITSKIAFFSKRNLMLKKLHAQKTEMSH